MGTDIVLTPFCFFRIKNKERLMIDCRLFTKKIASISTQNDFSNATGWVVYIAEKELTVSDPIYGKKKHNNIPQEL